LCAVRDPPRAVNRHPIDLIAGDAKPEATHEKEAGHSANAPSVLEGFKKLDGT
jgi:cytochrome c oxidase subunit 5b